MLIRIKYIILSIFTSIVASCQTEISETKILIPLIDEYIVVAPVKLTLKDTTTYNYSWQEEYNSNASLINNIKPPKGYERVTVNKNTYASWLQHLPISTDNTVYLYNGEKKYIQDAQFKVLDIDVSSKDLQQCADAVMRLRAEYLYTSNQYNKIHFKYTNGVNISFLKWSSGYYPSLKKNKVVWITSTNNKSYKSFKKYMTNIFMYAGTASLEKEMKSIPLSAIEAGDVFIKGGFPGHAVIVLDVIVNKITNDKAFIIAQSYMPAQSIHILKNPNKEIETPWYSINDIENELITPEWTFYPNQLKRFVE